MLSQAQRTTILEMSAQGVSKHEIARLLRISGLSVRNVVRANSISVPRIALARTTLRTLRRDIRSRRAISCLLAPCALISRIVVRCAWLSMLVLLFLFHSFGHPVQLAPRAFQPLLHLLLLRVIHLRQSRGEPAAGA